MHTNTWRTGCSCSFVFIRGSSPVNGYLDDHDVFTGQGYLDWVAHDGLSAEHVRGAIIGRELERGGVDLKMRFLCVLARVQQRKIEFTFSIAEAFDEDAGAGGRVGDRLPSRGAQLLERLAEPA